LRFVHIELISTFFFFSIFDIYYLCKRIQFFQHLDANSFFVKPEWGEYLEIVIAGLHSSPHNTKVNEAKKSWTHKPAAAPKEALSFYRVNKNH